MAHGINYNHLTNKHAFVSVKEKPWHGLGQIVENAMTSKECITIAGLDYEVHKVPNYADIDYNDVENGTRLSIEKLDKGGSINNHAVQSRFIKNPTSYSTVRADTRQILGTVGRDYTVINNNEAFDFFDAIVGTQEAIYETAGALGKGEVIFITAKIPTLIKIGSHDSDNVERYIVMSNAHDGSRSLEAFVTTVRVVCNNTLAVARSSAKARFKIRHTKNANVRIDDARQILNLERNLIETFALGAANMANVKIDDSAAMDIISSSFFSKNEAEAVNAIKLANEVIHLEQIVSSRKNNIINDTFNHYKEGPGAHLDTAKDTVWGAYNAVASYYQNGKNYNSKEDRMTSLLYGDGHRKITKAYNEVSDFMREVL